MEIGLKEERVTLQACKWLKKNKWKIIYFDFPECGSTKRFPCSSTYGSNVAWVTPDLLAFKKGKLLVSENKSKFSKKDYQKIKNLKKDKKFKTAVIQKEVLSSKTKFYFGICLPEAEANKVQSFAKIKACDFLGACSDLGFVLKFKSERVRTLRR